MLTAPVEHVTAGGVHYDFLKWTFDGNDKPAGQTVLAETMAADHTAVAVYGIRTWTLAVQSTPITGVEIPDGKPGITNCTATCDDQESVVLTAPVEHMAADGGHYRFMNWKLDDDEQPAGEKALAVTMDIDHTAIAVYLRTWTLTVQSTPITGVGIIGDTPGTTDYASTCDDQKSVTAPSSAKTPAAVTTGART